MKKIDDFLSKKFIKYLLNFILPICIGELFSAIIGYISNNDFSRSFTITLIILILSIIIYGICIYRYIEIDKTLEEKLVSTEKENALLKSALGYKTKEVKVTTTMRYGKVVETIKEVTDKEANRMIIPVM